MGIVEYVKCPKYHLNKNVLHADDLMDAEIKRKQDEINNSGPMHWSMLGRPGHVRLSLSIAISCPIFPWQNPFLTNILSIV